MSMQKTFKIGLSEKDITEISKKISEKVKATINITDITVDDDGNLVFVTETGENFVVDFSTQVVEYVDEDSVPCLSLTQTDVNVVKNISGSESSGKKYMHNVAIKLYRNSAADNCEGQVYLTLFNDDINPIDNTTLFEYLPTDGVKPNVSVRDGISASGFIDIGQFNCEPIFLICKDFLDLTKIVVYTIELAGNSYEYGRGNYKVFDDVVEV